MSRLILGIAFISGLSLFIESCQKKSDPTPTTSSSSNNLSGTNSGTITVDGTLSTVSGYNPYTSTPYSINSRNMTPANSYPTVDFYFATKPTKDSVYSSTLYNFISITTSSNSTDFFGSSAYGTSHFTVSGFSSTVFTVTYSNLVVQSTTFSTHSISGSLTVNL